MIPARDPKQNILGFQSVSIQEIQDSRVQGFQDSRIIRFRDFMISGFQDSKMKQFQDFMSQRSQGSRDTMFLQSSHSCGHFIWIWSNVEKTISFLRPFYTQLQRSSCCGCSGVNRGTFPSGHRNILFSDAYKTHAGERRCRGFSRRNPTNRGQPVIKRENPIS